MLDKLLFAPLQEPKQPKAPAPEVTERKPAKKSTNNLLLVDVSIDGSNKLYTYVTGNKGLQDGDTVKVPTPEGYKSGKVRNVRPFTTAGLKVSLGKLKTI